MTLEGVGDLEHEWREWTGRAYHIRRRLTYVEQSAVGPVIDLRGTDEALRRFEACRKTINPQALLLAKEELGI
jgi:hypothetical protein